MGGFLAFVSFFVFVWAMVGLVNPSWGKLKYRRHAVGLLVLSFVILITGAGMMDSEETAVEEPESSVSTGSSAPPAEAVEAASATSFQTQISSALGSSNRDVQRVSTAQLQGERLFVQWAINDNLTSGMIAGSARLDIRNMLKVIADSQEPCTSVLFRGTFSLVDQLGNASEDTVVEATFTKSVIDRINFENFLTDNVYAIGLVSHDDLSVRLPMRESKRLSAALTGLGWVMRQGRDAGARRRVWRKESA